MATSTPFFSIITAVYNRKKFISCALNSLQNQSFQNYESVIIDGGSTDGTIQTIAPFLKGNTKYISEADDGIYYALNKGLNLASGTIIGFLHSDDFFHDEEVLQRVYEIFLDESIDIVYGDLNYVESNDTTKIVRKWRSGNFSTNKLHFGWMPPHPACFIRKRSFQLHGGFNVNYRISADYDLLLRYLINGNTRALYLPFVLVNMRIGGISNKSLSSIFRKMSEDYKIIKSHNLGGIRTLLCKSISKISQFF